MTKLGSWASVIWVNLGRVGAATAFAGAGRFAQSSVSPNKLVRAIQASPNSWYPDHNSVMGGLMEQEEALPSFVPEALVASGAGTWECDVVAGIFFLDPIASKLLGFDPRDGRRGVPQAAFMAAINPVDRARGAENMKHLFRDGGVFVFEHRVNLEPKMERWLLARGLYEKSATGAVLRGRGIVLDITQCKADGYVEGTAIFSRPYDSSPLLLQMRTVDDHQADEEQVGALLEITEHLIAAHRIAKKQSDESTLAIISMAMFHAGRRLRNEVDLDVKTGGA